MKDVVFANPGFFYLFIVLVAITGWYLLRGSRKSASMGVPGFEGLEDSRTPRTWMRHLLFAMRIAAIGLLIVAMARPQSTNRWQKVTSEGIDIVMCMDVSGSMRAMDFKPNRLESAKDVGIEFVNSRDQDRFGLVIFAGESFTQCPLTTDRAVVTNFMNELDFDLVEDGTAIGMGLATSVNRLKESRAKSKVVILLTDGVNNQGEIGPVTAAELAANYGIRVYTIGVGSKGTAPFPLQDRFGRTIVRKMEVEIDEDVLRKIAVLTGGKYFRATDTEKLRAVYEEIDQMEKTQMDVKQFSKLNDEYFPWVVGALLLFVIEIVLRFTLFRTLP